MSVTVAKGIMLRLYGQDIWDGFQPSTPNPEVQGWNGNHPSLTRLASAASGGSMVAIDVGVWKGQSTITLASAMKRSDMEGCVIAVDTFLGSSEHWAGPLRLFSRVNGIPDLYSTFLNNVYQAALIEYVVPMPQTSSAAASVLDRLGITASIVHIDAAHEYDDVMRDAAAYWKILRPGGYLIGDDYHETWPGVVRAAGEFSAKVGRPLAIESPKWILQKP
jgi:Methyltransferase domain